MYIELGPSFLGTWGGRLSHLFSWPSQLVSPGPSVLFTWKFLQPLLIGKGHIILVGAESRGYNSISSHLMGSCGPELAGHFI